MTLTNSLNGFDGAQELLIKLVEQSPEDWETRKRVVQVLFDSGLYREASKLVWNAPEVPSVSEEIVFTAKIVAMGQPERAVRLFSTMVETNQGNPEENLKVAKALMKQGLVLQALRFYGVATAMDTSLIDEDFELVLVNADCGDDNWRDLADGEDFPWDGPQDMGIADMMDDEGNGEASAAEILLSSVTQRVPLKAPVKDTAATTEIAPTHEQTSVKPTAQAKTPKPILSPAAEALVKQQSVAVTTPQEANEDGSFSSLVNFFKHKELEQGQDLDVAKKDPVKSQPLATIATSVDTRAHTTVDTRAELPPAPSSPLVQGFQPRPSDALKQLVPAPASTQAVESAPEPVPEAPSVDAPQPPVFSSQEIVAPVVEPQLDGTASEPVPRLTEAVVENVTPITQPLVSAEAPEPVVAQPEQEPEQPIAQEEDLSDVVANALAEREVSSPVSESGGLFSKIKNVFSRSKSDLGNETKHESVAEPVVSAAPVADAPKSAVEETTQVEASAPVENNPAQVVAPAASPLSTTVLRKPEQQQNEPPKELDGRTQLVALAPQDGSVFFDQLAAKYNNLTGDQLPPAAMVARDMANVDYVQLIREACSKDLNAFSKLLGLHRVMTESNCPAWVEDMDLLRKGYGDAVLATVVSKYSVSECREILGAVYQRPGAQAVAG